MLSEINKPKGTRVWMGMCQKQCSSFLLKDTYLNDVMISGERVLIMINKSETSSICPCGWCFRLVAITLLHVQTDHLSFVPDKGIPKSNTTIQWGERVLRTCPLALENMALVVEFEASVPGFRPFFKALQSS